MPVRSSARLRLALAAVTVIAMTGKSSRPIISAQPERASMAFPALGDEFLGPFPSWTNLKTAYRAAGNGIADDTDALQRSLDDLGTAQHSPVLFVPAGTYRITRTLTLKFTINVALVGEDTATTVIVWDGPEAGTMLHINGVAYSRFARLTFDGKRRASIAVDQSWDNSRPHFDTGNEYADDVFVDLEFGIHGGFKGHGFAETSIIRSSFLRNTRAGVALGNFNALDVWIWHSEFVDCATGVTNTSGAGNFHVYNSVFRDSTTADLSMGNTGGFSVRDSYSIGSRAFFTGSFTANPALIDLQRNTVLDPSESVAVRMGNQGPALLLDNTFRSRPGALGPVVEWSGFPSADVTSVGNTFTVSTPVKSNGRLTVVDDRFIPHDQLNPAVPALPATPPNLGRQVFEVRPGSGAGAIQSVIDAAAQRIGERPVVHFSHGTYPVARTVTLPPGDIQLTGDGYGTVLKWTGGGQGPVIRVVGPSKTSVREIQVDGGGRGDGIVVVGADQRGARIYLQQVQLRAGRQTDLFVDGLDETYVQLEDVGHAYSPDAASLRIVGGPSAAAGRPTAGRTTVFSGASAGNRISYEVSGGARVLIRDVWYESGAGPGFANVHDRATFTAQGLRIASPVNGSPPAFNIVNLTGAVTLLTADIDDRIAISGNGQAARFLGVALWCKRQLADCFLNTASPAARTVVLNSRQSTAIGIRSVSAADIGDEDESAFIRTMLEPTRRESAAVPHSLPPGITDVRLFRVWVANGRNNLTVTRRTTDARSLPD
jgi:Pectate lyase superfamily protein